jgi:drug/metabolite transporter (DMT)-like permease
VPASAIMLGSLFLDERLTGNEFLGMAAIGLGLAAIDGRPLRILRRQYSG